MVSIEMARCVARITGDGNLYYRYIRYSNTCKELLDGFVRDISKEFNHHSFTYGITNTGTPFVQIHGKALISKFIEFLPSYKSADVYIPKQVLNASGEVKRAYLRALFDDEGSVCIRVFGKTGEWKRNIKIDSKSYLLIEGIKTLLSELNISSNNIGRCDKEDKYWYYLGISGRENFIRFAKEIGFSHPVKQQKLLLLLKTYKKTYKRNYSGFSELKQELEEIKNRSHRLKKVMNSDFGFPHSVQYNQKRAPA